MGTCALVFLLPWQTRLIIEAGKINGGTSEYLSYSLYGTDILLIGLIALTFIFFRKKIFKFKLSKKNLILLLIFFLLSLGSLFFAENKLLALYFEVRILLAVSLFWLAFKFIELPRLASYFVFSLIAPATLALWQFLSQTSFENKWFGLAEHQAFLGGTSVIETFSNGVISGRWLRGYGSFDHPNILGGRSGDGNFNSRVAFSQKKGDGKRPLRNVFLEFGDSYFGWRAFCEFQSRRLGSLIGRIFCWFCNSFATKEISGLEKLVVWLDNYCWSFFDDVCGLS